MGKAQALWARLGSAPGGRHLALNHTLGVALDAALTVLFAPLCAACEAPLEHPSRGPVCPQCWSAILPLTPPLCDACGDPLPTWRVVSVPQARCPRCRRARRQVARARAIGAYDGSLRAIIHAFKYDRCRSLAATLGALMRGRGAAVLAGADAAIPVPLHPARQRERGFNQAADLAGALGLPVVHALARVRATAVQASLPAAQRHSNVRGAFAARPQAGTLAGRTVVLVDDVRTTGATLEACARVLKDGGVAEVRALTAARVVAGPR